MLGIGCKRYSFLQVRSGVTSGAELAKFEAVRYCACKTLSATIVAFPDFWGDFSGKVPEK